MSKRTTKTAASAPVDTNRADFLDTLRDAVTANATTPTVIGTSETAALETPEAEAAVEADAAKMEAAIAAMNTKLATVATLINLTEKWTPATLDKLFALNDGGKTVRRHLRKKFADASSHVYKESWTWAKSDKVLTSIVMYFADRYAAHPENLTTSK